MAVYVGIAVGDIYEKMFPETKIPKIIGVHQSRMSTLNLQLLMPERQSTHRSVSFMVKGINNIIIGKESLSAQGILPNLQSCNSANGPHKLS